MNLSFWEQEKSVGKPDVVVIGSGITGIQAAIYVKKMRPTWQVLVLERGPYPAGASTKNAGFACIGSPTEIADDLRSIGADRTFALMERRYEGLQILLNQVGPERLDYLNCGGVELFTKGEEAVMDDAQGIVEAANQAIASFSGVANAFRSWKNELGFGNVLGGIESVIEGQLHPGKMIAQLHTQAKELGVNIRTGITVLDLDSDSFGIRVETDYLGQIQADRAIVANNGFSRTLLPDLEVRTVRNQVLVTEEIPGLTWNGTFHYDRGYVYFRNVGNRILLGGFRNLGGAEEETNAFGLTEQIQSRLERFLSEVILPGQKMGISHRWSGILGVGESKEPIVREVMPNVFAAVRLGGMGVALGSWLGREVASKCTGQTYK